MLAYRIRLVKYSCVSSSAICFVWSQQSSRVVLIAKISFLMGLSDPIYLPALIRVGSLVGWIVHLILVEWAEIDSRSRLFQLLESSTPLARKGGFGHLG